MLLVPRQLLRTGMTGNVPYYGGRFTPQQAYAASHPSRSEPRPAPAGQRPAGNTGAAALEALQHLLDTGVVTPQEYQDLRARVTR
jgi:hypothetical protein